MAFACKSAGFDAPAHVEKQSSSPAPVVPVPSVNTTVEFGNDKVFHVGDNNFRGSSCTDTIQSHTISGTKYLFHFRVLQDSTTVNISIQYICGIDLNQSNHVSLQKDGGQVFFDQLLQAGASSFVFPAQLLAKGDYSVIVESRYNNTEYPTGDHDDFLVGNIKISGDKPVQQLSVNAQ